MQQTRHKITGFIRFTDHTRSSSFTNDTRARGDRLKNVMTSVDVAALLPELDVLIGARLEKAYQLLACRDSIEARDKKWKIRFGDRSRKAIAPDE